MQDRLEKFIRENRKSFEDADPPKKIWISVDKHLSGNKDAKVFRIAPLLKVAAIAILFMGIGAIGGNYLFSSNPSESPLAFQELKKEYAEAEIWYVSQINYKLESIKGTPAEKQLLKDLEDLDKDFKLMKAELGKDISNEQVISAIIENYRTRINILEKVLNRMNQIDNKKLQKNEGKSM